MDFLILYSSGALLMFVSALIFNRIPIIRKHCLICPGNLVLTFMAFSWAGLCMFIIISIALILIEIMDYYEISDNFERLCNFIEGKKDD